MSELGFRAPGNAIRIISLLPILATCSCEGRLHTDRSRSEFQVFHSVPSVVNANLEIRDVEKSNFNVASIIVGKKKCLVRLEKGGRHISGRGSFANIGELFSLDESYCIFVPSTTFDLSVHINSITSSELKGVLVRANSEWISRIAVQISDNVTMFVQEVDSNRDLRFTKFCVSQYGDSATSLLLNSNNFEDMQLTVLDSGWQDGIYELKLEGPESFHGVVELDIRDRRTFKRLRYDQDYTGWRKLEALSNVGGRKSLIWRITMKSNRTGTIPSIVEVVWTNELGTDHRTISTKEIELVDWER